MEGLIFDTTFLIDFQRERINGLAGAHRFLKERADWTAYLSVIVCGEFGEGFKTRTDRIYRSAIDSFELLPVTEKTADRYSQITRELRDRGMLIGANDLWIAAAALEHDLSLVTRDHNHFSRVPGLRIERY